MNLEYVDLALPSGTLWAKCNLGAEKETDFGLFYQWGDTEGYDGDAGHGFNWNDYKYRTPLSPTKYNKTDNKLVLDNEDDPVFVATKCEQKMPTKEQFQELITYTNHEWTIIDGVNGTKFINKNDNTKYIFIPAAGSCYDGIRVMICSLGCVWSASHGESGSYNAWYMYFNADNVSMNDCSRCIGFTVRGVKDSKNLHNTLTKPKEVTTEKCQVDNSEKIPIDKRIYNQLVRLGIIDSSVRADNQGNSDYAKHIIQPWSIWIDWNLNAWDADIVKRVLRTKEGDPRELDYKKIIHICNERIRQLKNGMT